jgi:hypothetical protein
VLGLDVPIRLPAKILRQAQAAAKGAISLTSEDRARLLEALTNYEPRGGMHTPDDVAYLAVEARLDFRLVQDVLYLISVLAQDASAGNAEFAETLTPDVDLRPRVLAFLEELRPIAREVSHRLDFQQSIEWAMPSFREVFIANDLRALPNEDDKPLILVPVSVIKLVLDEGQPIVFQCLPGGMTRMIDALVEATDTLRKLQEIAEAKS